MRLQIQLGQRVIGAGTPVYLVAEMSANHNRDFEQAVRLVQAAKQAGADAVKLQTYTPDAITLRSDVEPFRIGGGTLWDGRTLHDLYAEACMPWEWQPKLKAEADKLGRYEVTGEEAVISVSLDPQFRGAGLGSRLIAQASRTVLWETKVRVIHAHVKPENEASVRAFTSAGYSPLDPATVCGQSALHFILRKGSDERDH